MDVRKLSCSLTIVAILSLSLFVACGNGVQSQDTLGETKQEATLQIEKDGDMKQLVAW